ncbi:MAG: DUF6186 family protein [Leifsonia sp.]
MRIITVAGFVVCGIAMLALVVQSRRHSAAHDSAGRDSAGLDSAGLDSAGFDSAGFDSAGFTSAGFDSGRLARFGSLLDVVMEDRAARVTILLLWWWLGWHFLVTPPLP